MRPRARAGSGTRSWKMRSWLLSGRSPRRSVRSAPTRVSDLDDVGVDRRRAPARARPTRGGGRRGRSAPRRCGRARSAASARRGARRWRSAPSARARAPWSGGTGGRSRRARGRRCRGSSRARSSAGRRRTRSRQPERGDDLLEGQDDVDVAGLARRRRRASCDMHLPAPGALEVVLRVGGRKAGVGRRRHGRPKYLARRRRPRHVDNPPRPWPVRGQRGATCARVRRAPSDEREYAAAPQGRARDSRRDSWNPDRSRRRGTGRAPRRRARPPARRA